MQGGLTKFDIGYLFGYSPEEMERVQAEGKRARIAASEPEWSSGELDVLFDWLQAHPTHQLTTLPKELTLKLPLRTPVSIKSMAGDLRVSRSVGGWCRLSSRVLLVIMRIHSLYSISQFQRGWLLVECHRIGS